MSEHPFGIPGATPTLWKRFWAKVDQSGGPEACWSFTGYKRPRRRGRRGKLRVGGRGSRFISADRLALALITDGDLEKTDPETGEKLQACHNCGNGDDPIHCVNPKHLYWGTNEQNQADKKIHRLRLVTEGIRSVTNAPLARQ